MEKVIDILDSTLRDGAQGEGISFSVEDKLAIVQALDVLGIPFVEAGNPGSNPKDLEFFQRASQIPLKHTKLVAFGSTCRKQTAPEEDKNLSAILRTPSLFLESAGISMSPTSCAPLWKKICG